MYLSFFPYIVFQFLSREAHSVFSILWYISVMALTLQLGSDQLRSHIVFSVLTFVGNLNLSTRDAPPFSYTPLLIQRSTEYQRLSCPSTLFQIMKTLFHLQQTLHKEIITHQLLMEHALLQTSCTQLATATTLMF